MSKDMARLPRDLDPESVSAAPTHISTEQGRIRGVSLVEPLATPTRHPEQEWAITKEAKAWFSSIEKQMTYKQIGMGLSITPKAAKQAESKANKALTTFRADPGWVGWPDLMASAVHF